MAKPEYIAYGGYPLFVRTARRQSWTAAERELADDIIRDVDFPTFRYIGLAELKTYLRDRGATEEAITAAERLSHRFYKWHFHGAGRTSRRAKRPAPALPPAP